MDIAALGVFFLGVAVCFALLTMYAMPPPCPSANLELMKSVQIPYLCQP